MDSFPDGENHHVSDNEDNPSEGMSGEVGTIILVAKHIGEKENEGKAGQEEIRGPRIAKEFLHGNHYRGKQEHKGGK